MMFMCAQVWANDVQQSPAEKLADKAKAMWDSGAIGPALDILEEGIQQYPDALALKTLRGDMLATFRDPGEAIKAYDTVLASNPTALDVRWAKWSVWVRWGRGEESIAELRRIADIDGQNPWSI